MNERGKNPIAIRPRESVILAANFASLVAWYKDVLGFAVTNLIEKGFHYASLATPSGIRIGIASAKEMDVLPGDRANNTVVLQFEVDDVKALFAHIEQAGGAITGGPTLNEQDNFWFGSFADPEGNPVWVVDKNCP